MHPKVEVDEGMTRRVTTEELAKGIVLCSPEGWALWRMRLSELSAETGNLQMTASIVERTTEALNVMESVEDKRGRQVKVSAKDKAEQTLTRR